MLVKLKINIFEIKDQLLFFLPLSPTSDGSAAAVIVSEIFIQKHPEVQKTAVEILAIEMATDLPSTFESNDCMRIVNSFRIERKIFKFSI